jgi:hypothetical protein
MKDLFCNKRQTRVDTEFEICNDCFKKKKSGYKNQNMCKEFNITFLEKEDNDSNKL